MIKITKSLFDDPNQNKYTFLKGKIPQDIFSALPDALFFDIETTGLSARNSMCYLIGMVYLKDGLWEYTQMFADSPSDETCLLTDFFKIAGSYKYLIHFNGESFDIPFILQRCRLLELPFVPSLPESIDLFKRIRKLSKLLQLENFKQKTIEEFLGINRPDKYSGKELISIYRDYVISKNEDSEKLLLLHNHDDIKGLVEILPMLCYETFINAKTDDSEDCNPVSFEINETTDFEGNEIKELLISAKLTISVPVRITLKKDFFYAIISDETINLRIPFINQELKYFYPNYKDYYYLPDEDTAIHKSVASYVDKNHRKPARADTCYVRKSGDFLPQPEEVFTPSLRKAYKDNISYFQPGNKFIKSGDMHLYNEYIRAIIKYLITM